jgi:hypothetical protein
MGAVTSLVNTHLSVDAGAEVACEVRVRNSGQVVDQFAVDIVGDATGWATATPNIVNLLPGAEATVRVVFSPPRTSEVLAGVVPFGIRVLSREDPYGSVVEEGDVEVQPFRLVAAEVVPAKARASRRARFRLVVDNNGNEDTPVEIVAIDPEDELRIMVEPQAMLTKPGTATVVKATVAPHRRFLRGDPKTHQFQLVALPEGKDPVTTNATLVQLPLLPGWVIPAAAALLAMAIALVVLWFTLFRPAVASIAQDATQAQASQAQSAAAQASKAAQQASSAASQAQQASGGGSGGGSGSGAGGGSGAGAGGNKSGTGGAGGGAGGAAGGGAGGSGGSLSSVAAGAPVEFRIATAANPVTNNSFQNFSYTAPNHKTMVIGDLVLQNPLGDNGILQLKVGNNVVLEEGLANFRDLDYHFVDQLHVAADQQVTVAVSCQQPGAGATQCTPSVSFSGQLGQ